MFPLIHPNEYEGGEFFLYDSISRQYTFIKPKRLGNAIVFLSETGHGVQPIMSGSNRESFVTELWVNDDSPLGMCRPTTDEWDKEYPSSSSATTRNDTPFLRNSDLTMSIQNLALQLQEEKENKNKNKKR